MSLFKKKKKHLETTTMDYGVRMITVSKAGSANTEQFNTIRTNIEFSSADEQFKSIMLTSSMASEGKSTVAANLAVSFARQGKKTLLIFIISDDSADIIELCAAMFSDQMFHQRAGCMVVVNSGEVKIRYFIQKRNDRNRGSSGADYDFFLKFMIGNKSKIQKNSIEV